MWYNLATVPGKPSVSIGIQELIGQLKAADAELRIEAPDKAVRAAWRRAIHAASASGKLPPGFRLRHKLREASG